MINPITTALIILFPLAGLAATLVNIDVRNCGAGDTGTCRGVAAGDCCNAVPRFGIQSTMYSDVPGETKIVEIFADSSRFACDTAKAGVFGKATYGCVDAKGYTYYGGSAWLNCAALRCLAVEMSPENQQETRRDADEEDVPLAEADLVQVPCKKNRQPDTLRTGGKYYFINAVMRVPELAHLVTPMTMEKTQEFYADYKVLSDQDLYAKYKEYTVEVNDEMDKLIQGWVRNESEK